MTRYKVWLDGMGLHDLDPAILITDVQEHAPALMSEAASRAMGEGRIILRHDRHSLMVTVHFVIRQAHPARRSAILRRVKDWAQHGTALSVSHRPGQRLQVAPGEISSHSALRWTQEMTLSFTTCHLPYWEEERPASCTPAAGTIFLPGNGPAAQADLFWRSPFTGAATLLITTPLSRITLQSVPVAEGSELRLIHPCGVLIATLDGADVLPLRTPDSSDDLLLPSGRTSPVAMQVNAQPADHFTLTARGLWL